MSSLVLLLVCLVPAVLAKGCCLPEQWEGKIYGSGFFTTGSRLFVQDNESAFGAYDARNKKLAVYGKALENGVLKRFRIIEDYSEGQNKIYVIDPVLKKCESSTLDNEFPELCFTDSAKLLGESFVGTGENSLDVTIYETKLKGGNTDITSFMVVTTKGCVPVYAGSVGKDDSITFLHNSDFAGITVGIKNSDVFDIPDYCDKMPFDLIRDKLPRIPRWKNYWL